MILVSGSTGNVGRHLVELLLTDGHQVRALSRDPAGAQLPAEVETLRGDLSDSGLVAAALTGVEAAYLTVFGDPAPVAAALAEVPVRRTVLISSNCARTRPDLVVADRIRAVEQALRAVAPDLTVLRPAQFASNTAHLWRPMIARGVVTAPFGDQEVPVIDPYDIAAVAALTLTDDRHRGQTYELTGGERISPRRKVAVLATVLDRTLGFTELTEEQARGQLAEHFGPAMVDYFVAKNGHPTEQDLLLMPTVEELLGRPPLSYADWAERQRADLL